MRYRSTRGGSPSVDFRGATMAGLAPDGGLYLPEEWPTLSTEALRDLAGRPYAEVAARVMAPFTADVLDADELLALTTRAYATFDHAAVAPLVQLDERHWLLELFHGPTLAFKDVALQLLALLFERFAERPLTLIGATSGDTGSAAIAALAGRAGLDVVMLHPAGRVSAVQRRQMTTVLSPNVHNVAIEGSFDDAQRIVKALFRHPGLAGHTLSAVNSINWARLLPQIVYYAVAAVRLGAPDRRVAFSVPTGNFGNAFAGYAAAAVGVPIERLIVATNDNDILHRALADGDYSAGAVTPTAAPSMDIQVSSNFERLLAQFGGASRVAEHMGVFEGTGALSLPHDWREASRPLFDSRAVDAAGMTLAMTRAKDRAGEIVDPHTAIGLAAAWEVGASLPADVPVVTLATAHPAKFPDAVERATGLRPGLPPRLGDLFERQERCVTLPADTDAVADHVASVVPR